MKFVAWTLILLPVLVGAASPRTFRNPVIAGLASDPTMIRVGDDYFLSTSSFEYFPGAPIYQSKDLVHWKLISYALTRPSQVPLMKADANGTGGLYASTLRYKNGKYYLISTNYGGPGGFYVTATDPKGPWSDAVPYWNWGVDPDLFWDDDGKVYLTHPEGCDGWFMQTTIDLSKGKLDSATKKFVDGANVSSNWCPEGQHMFKKDGKYFLMAAGGGTGYGHMETVMRGDSPKGPFETWTGNPVVTQRDRPSHPIQGIGHCDLVQTPTQWWMACLGFRPRNGNFHHLGRETFLVPVSWTSDGWFKASALVESVMVAPDLPDQPWTADPVRDEFDSTALRLPWNFVRNPHDADWSLSARPGWMRLNGSKVKLQDLESPAAILRRQSGFFVDAAARLSFDPAADSAEAGMLLRGNDSNHVALVVTSRNGKRVVAVRKYLRKTRPAPAAPATVGTFRSTGTGNLTLRITSTESVYSFWLEEEGKARVLVDTLATKALSKEVIGGFTGVFLGIYATGNGSASPTPADFDWFDFQDGSQSQTSVGVDGSAPRGRARKSGKTDWHPIRVDGKLLPQAPR